MEYRIKLFNLLVDTLYFSDNLQKTYYKKLFLLLAENSFSFGLKPLMEMNEKITQNLEKLYFYDFTSIYFENFDLNDKEKSISLKKMYLSIENKENKYQSPILKEKDMLLIFLNSLVFLYKEEKKYETIIKSFLTEESYSFGFKPINDIINYIEKELGKIYVIFDQNDWFEWFCYYNEFGKKNLEILQNEKSIKIKNKKDFINFLLKNKFKNGE